ncbi:MAG: UbiA family prenyltransferase [Hyphomonadaceae bacterium]
MSSPGQMGARAASPPLAVDLDGTVLKTDVLFEGLAAALARARWLLILAPLIALLFGRPLLKRLVARACPLNPAALPYREDLIAWLQAEKARGRAIWLATAAARAPAEAVAAHLGFFDGVLSSEGRLNLKGAAKARALAAALPEGFVYVGDSAADLAVWRHAAGAVLVDASPSVEARARALGAPIEQRFARAGGGFKTWLRALRAQHWLKNTLVFAAIPAAHVYGDPHAWAMAGLGFVLLNVIASSSYLLNDLVDLGADRAHAEKRRRPFAAGDLPLSAGLALAPAGLALGLAAAFALSAGFGWFAALYVALTLAYSFALKRAAFLDVLVLGALFTLRVMMGAALIGVAVSPFLALFSMFLFTSLALAKRHAELLAKAAEGRREAPGRGYRVDDRGLTAFAGAFAGVSAIVLLVLYIHDETAMAAFTQPLWLWVLPLAMLAWLTRIWLLCRRGQLTEDPLLFAAHDRWSWALGALIVLDYALAVL